MFRWTCIFLLACTCNALGGPQRPKPRVIFQDSFDTRTDGWRAAGDGTVTIERKKTYRKSSGALCLNWTPTGPKSGWLVKETRFTVTPDTWITFVYCQEGKRAGGMAVRFVTGKGERFTCSGLSAPTRGWRRVLVHVCFDWWARQFCFVGTRGRVLPPGTVITAIEIGTRPRRGTGQSPRRLFLDNVVLFEAFGDREIRALFNPRGVVRPPRPCPIPFSFPSNLEHPYLVTSRNALEKRSAAFRKDREGGPVRRSFEKLYAYPINEWIAQFIGKLKAPEPVKAPEDLGAEIGKLDEKEEYDEILNPRPPPPTALTDSDWEKCFQMAFEPHAADPRFLEEKANICPRCARGLSFDPLLPKWHQCPRCRRRYHGPAYDNVWEIQMQRRDMGIAVKAAWAYRISGQERYARLAKKIALGYCHALEYDLDSNTAHVARLPSFYGPAH